MSEDLEIIFDLAKDSMSNAISHLEKKLLNIRAGKANPNMLTNVFVDYYGTSTPISQVANVNTPDGRTLIIQPWDKSMLQEIEKGIEVANLGFNPMNNGENIIINVPVLTEERRRELVKQAKIEVEEAKIAIRNARKDANNEIKKSEVRMPTGAIREVGSYEITLQFHSDVTIEVAFSSAFLMYASP